MTPVAVTMSNMSGSDLIGLLVMLCIVNVALLLAMWHSVRRAGQRHCEHLTRELAEQRKFFLSLLEPDLDVPPMSDPLPPEQEIKGVH